MNTVKKYWFFFEPYVYISFVDYSVFLYNTLDGQSFESVDPVIYDIILEIKNKPEGVIVLTQEQIEKKEINSFIRLIRDCFMGDLIDTSISDGSPVQFVPILNIQTDTARMEAISERAVGEDILLNLNELIFYMDSPSVSPNKYYPSNKPFEWKSEKTGNFDYIKLIIQQIPLSIIENLTISIVAGRLENIENIETLVGLLNTTKAKKKFELYYKDNILNEVFNIENLSITLNIDFPFDNESFIEANRLLDKKEIQKRKYAFFISSQEDMDSADKTIEKYNISEYALIPYYTGNNDDFFKENIFLSKDDLFSEPVSMRKIFLHQSLNIESFGKLHISPAGDVFPGLFSPRLGSISQHTILEMLDKEFISVKAWFRTRNYTPCNKCHFQWLCPPPGNYEFLLEKNNLCDVIISDHT